MRSSIVVVLLVSSVAAGADDLRPTPVKPDAPNHVRTYFARVDTMRAIDLKQMPQYLFELRAELARAQRNQDQKKITELQARIQAGLEAQEKLLVGAYVVPLPLEDPPKVGDIGTLPATFQVQRVVDPHTAVVRVALPVPSTKSRFVAKPTSFLTPPKDRSVLVMLNCSTEGWVEGSNRDGTGELWHVSKSRPYSAAEGSTDTVFVLEPIELERWIDL
ncbi:MAG: hypothetical protein SGJ19_14160 [Planctomycetia bacterium]|nr:hypothetical protein [Planctomycetia bacterium]